MTTVASAEEDGPEDSATTMESLEKDEEYTTIQRDGIQQRRLWGINNDPE